MAAKRKGEALHSVLLNANQMRILFVLDCVWALFWGFIAAHQTEGELDVPYTVIRAHSAMGVTLALTSDYIGDFYSLCFTKQGTLCMRFMDEFTSCAARLEMTLNEEKNREGLAC